MTSTALLDILRGFQQTISLLTTKLAQQKCELETLQRQPHSLLLRSRRQIITTDLPSSLHSSAYDSLSENESTNDPMNNYSMTISLNDSMENSMNEPMNDLMDDSMNESMNDSRNELMNDSMNELMNDSMNELMNESMKKPLNESVYEPHVCTKPKHSGPLFSQARRRFSFKLPPRLVFSSCTHVSDSPRQNLRNVSSGLSIHKILRRICLDNSCPKPSPPPPSSVLKSGPPPPFPLTSHAKRKQPRPTLRKQHKRHTHEARQRKWRPLRPSREESSTLLSFS